MVNEPITLPGRLSIFFVKEENAVRTIDRSNCLESHFRKPPENLRECLLTFLYIVTVAEESNLSRAALCEVKSLYKQPDEKNDAITSHSAKSKPSTMPTLPVLPSLFTFTPPFQIDKKIISFPKDQGAFQR
jgi:hypothetical protein